MIRLKDILLEYSDTHESTSTVLCVVDSLPTLSDSTAKHEQNIKEQSEFDEDGHFGIPFEHDNAVVHAFNRVVASYRDATKGMDDDQAYSVSQQLAEFFT